MKDKGLSPLIAMVVLVALVMSLAVVISGFLGDFVGEREHKAREDAERTLDCTEMSMEIREDSINMNDDLTFLLTSRNSFPVRGLRIITYDDDGSVENDMNPEPDVIEALTTKEILVNETVDDPSMIQVRNKYCPNFEVTVEKDWRDEWVVGGY